MKTWEMIKELTENPEKEFKTRNFYGNPMLAYIAKEYRCKDGGMNDWVIVIKTEGEVDEMALNDFMLSREWEEAIEPVDFMTAFNAFRKDKKDIYCMFDGTKYVFPQNYEDNIKFDEDLIAFGKWYIEGEINE